MNAREIAVAVMADRWQRSFCLPGYTPRNWWECDVFELTGAGFFREYEIKLSRADFKRDAEKDGWAGHWDPGEGRKNKHELLAQGDARGPVQFWFVVPEDLVTVDEVPEWAGLLYFRENKERRLWERPGYIVARKKAPRLHNTRLDPKVERHARGITYYRMHLTLGARPDLHCPEIDEVADGLGI